MMQCYVRGRGWKWLGGNARQSQRELRKCLTAQEAGHGFPDSGRCQSGPRIIGVMRKAPLSWMAQVCALLAALACIGLTGCAGVSSGGPGQNPTPTGADQLSVSPATMSFGSVAVGSEATQSGTLTAGSSDVDVTSAAWTGQGYSVSGITFPVTVAAGKSVNYTVTFAPQAAGEAAGSISFVNNGSNSPVVETLGGQGALAGAHTVALSWDASASTVIGYNVYRGTQSGGPYQRLTLSPQPTTSYSDSTVLSGTTYYYVATAVDSSDVESAYSNQAQAVIP